MEDTRMQPEGEFYLLFATEVDLTHHVCVLRKSKLEYMETGIAHIKPLAQLLS